MIVLFSVISSAIVQGAAVNFQPTSDRTLIMVNNPEVLIQQDLGDYSTPQHIYQQEIQGGKIRLFFEHGNGTGTPIGYGIRLFNPGNQPVNVTVERSGYEPKVCSGSAFVKFFKNQASTVIIVPPQQFKWLWHSDKMVSPKLFFSGVVDFNWQAGTPLRIDTVAFQNFNNVNANSQYMGYRTENRNGTDQSRVYKGVVLYNDGQKSTDLIADIGGITLDNDTSNGVQKNWYTNSKASEPFGIRFLPNSLSGNEQTLYAPQANLGGWGIVYTIKGWVENKSTTNRCLGVYLELTNNDHGYLAWWGDKKAWLPVELTPTIKKDLCNDVTDVDEKDSHQRREPNNYTLKYYSFNLPAGASRSFEAKIVTGGPSSTNFHHWLQTEDCPTQQVQQTQQNFDCGLPQNGQLYGALAYSESTGMWAGTWDCSSLDEATQMAQMVCGYDDCKVDKGWFYGSNRCAAIATGDNDIYGEFGGGVGLDETENRALIECQKRGGTNCEILCWACNSDKSQEIWALKKEDKNPPPLKP